MGTASRVAMSRVSAARSRRPLHASRSTNRSSPACPHVVRTSAAPGKLRNTRGGAGTWTRGPGGLRASGRGAFLHHRDPFDDDELLAVVSARRGEALRLALHTPDARRAAGDSVHYLLTIARTLAGCVVACAAYRRSSRARWGTTTSRGSAAEARPASNTPKRVSADPASSASPGAPATSDDGGRAPRRRARRRHAFARAHQRACPALR